MATRISPPQNKTYYINPAYLTFVENSGYGANLIQVSASSSCYISVYDPANGIGYSDADRNYRRWKVTAYNNKFPDNNMYHAYVRLERNGTSALVVYSRNLYNVDGSSSDGSIPSSDSYFYIKIGEVSGTDGTSLREIVYDTGYLESNQGLADSGDLNDMWELDKYSTPWLIRAKQWLQSFTVKGFITLVGGIVFKKGDIEKTVSDIKRSTDSDEDVPVSDETIPTTQYVENMLESYDDRFLRKDQDDETPYSLGVGGYLSVGGDFSVGGSSDLAGPLDVGGKTTAKKGLQIGETYIPGILTGTGGYFDEYANGEVERLTIRRELRVPSIVFNQVEVLVGDKWRSPGAGVIERVEPDPNTDGSLKDTGTLWLKLEEGQIGAVFANAICMGIFHDFGNPANNATADMDDSRGNRTFAGFTTSYFTITEISDYTDENGVVWHNKQCRYQIRPVSERWTGQAHPYEQMNFTCYGIFTDNEELLRKYGTSVYETRTYTRMLFKQNTWEIGAANLAMQYGDLSNMSIHGYDMDGYSIFLNNIYLTGIYKQVNAQGDPVLTANERGKWISGQMYSYYDRVSHKGSLWLCVSESGTNTEPSEGDASWLLEVKSGSSVTAAGRWESSKVPYAMNSIVTFADKVWISNKETSEPPFGIFLDGDSSRLTYEDGSYVLVDTLIQSEDWDLLLDAPQLTNGEDGKSVQLRYSSDQKNWHDTFVEGDIWMQQRVGDDALWSDPIRITGESGAAGKDGTYHDYQFAVNDSLTVAPTTGWQDTPPPVGIGQYLWMRTRFVDPNSATENAWSVVRIGGEKGRGVESVTEYYQVSESDTVAPTEWVQGTMPQLTETLKYLWNYEVIKYTDTEEVSTTPIVIGMHSKDGNGIASVVEYYGLTDNPDEKPAKWYTDMLIPTQDVPYLWNKVITTYTNGDTGTVVRIIAVHGEKGDSITAVGEWKTGLAVPALGVVTMYGNSYLARVATTNPPMWVYTDADGSRLVFSAGEYVLTGEENSSEYELLVQSGKDGSDGKSHEYIFIHTTTETRPSTPASVQTDDYIPSGWHDDPMGASESLPYEWVCMRTKKEGIWSGYSTPSVWTKWAFDAIVADIDNEMDNVALDSEGKAVSATTIQLTASMYYGSVKQSLTAISVGSVTGISSSFNLATGAVTLVVAKGASLGERTEVPITISAVIAGKTQTRKMVFVLAGIKGGADGADAVLYDIVTSASSIVKRKDGSYDVASVSATRTKTIGGTTTETTDGVLKYSIDGGAEKEISNNSPVSSSLITSGVKFSLYDADGRLLDRESVPMIVDGKDGEDGVGINSVTITYAKSTTNSIPTSGWQNTIPAVGEGEYLWTRTVTDYTDSSVADTVTYTYTYQGKSGQAGTSVSVLAIQYQVGSSATDAPTGTWSNTMVEAPQGKYLWTKTTFSDGSIAYGVSRQAEDGVDGEDGVGIKSVTITYGKSSSASSIPTSWSGTIPSVGEGEYLWTRTITDYTDDSIQDTVTYTYSYQGKTGQAGTSVSVKSVQYQAGTSPTTAPTGTWSNDVVSVPQGQYLWTKTTFSDGNVAYGVARQAEDGKDGEGFTMMGNWVTGLVVPKMGVVTMKGNPFAAKVSTLNPPLWCWTDSDGSRLIFSDTEYILTGEENEEYERWAQDGKDGEAGADGKDGKDGERGNDGKDGVSSFKSTVFIRSNSMPKTPTGGTYDSPIPTSTPAWSDGIPEGEYILWASNRVFSGNGLAPQQDTWSTPRQMTDTASFDVEWSSVSDDPGNPYDNPGNWSNESSSSTVWMATRTKSNGTWGSWQVCKVKGETGKDGAPGGPGKTGDPGPQGIQGCIIRKSEWKSGVEYRNDEDLKSGTRYLDVALVRNNASASGWDAYKCKNTHTSSTANAPGNATYWEAFTMSTSSIFTSLIIAKDASIDFVQGNELLIKGSDGKTVEAGLSGSSATGGDIRLWVGGETPDNAPFTVDKTGVLKATKAEIKGTVYADSGEFKGTVTLNSLYRKVAKGGSSDSPTDLTSYSGFLIDGYYTAPILSSDHFTELIGLWISAESRNAYAGGIAFPELAEVVYYNGTIHHGVESIDFSHNGGYFRIRMQGFKYADWGGQCWSLEVEGSDEMTITVNSPNE